MIKNPKEISTPVPKVTLDDLAVMIKNGFDKVDNRFENLESRFELFRTDMLEFKVNTEQSLYVLDTNMKNLEIRVGKLEYTLYEEMRPTMETIQLLWRGHERRIGALERKTGLVRR